MSLSEFEQDVEDLFPPRPGGMVDRTRRQKADDASGPQPVSAPAARMHAVRTLPESPLTASAQTVVVSTSGQAVVRVLGYDPNRHRAVLMALDEPVIVATTQNQASDPRNAANAAGMTAGGFVLPAPSAASPALPLVIESCSEVWVAATSATKGRVSVWSEAYADQT